MRLRSRKNIIGLIFLLVTALYQIFYITPNAKELKKELIAMHQEINPIPGASFLDEVSYMRNGGEVTRAYITSATSQEIIDHYDKEFRRNGWTYIESLEVQNPETNEIRKVARYTKNTHYKGNVGYPGESKTINTIRITFEFNNNKRY